MGEKKKERTKTLRSGGAGGVGPFRICNDSVCHWWAFGIALIVGQTVEGQGACVGTASSMCHPVRKCKVSTSRGHQAQRVTFHLMG